MQRTLRLGLVGKDVSKSRSERMHRFILHEFGVACEYENFSVGAEDFDCAARRLMGDFDGFNVTIPYKRDVMEYLSGVEGFAAECGAVNTVLTETGKGFNTDGEGFLTMLHFAGFSPNGKKILVLGGGGSGRSTAAVLKKTGAQVYVYQRRREALEELCSQLGVSAAASPNTGGYDLLINCTGVGMHTTVGQSPVEACAFDGAEAAVDLIYEPTETAFLRLAKERGLATLNGESMLFFQAYYADCLYLNRGARQEEAVSLYEKYRKE